MGNAVNFPLAFAGVILLLLVLVLLLVAIAEAGAKPAVERVQLLRDATPAHDYTNLDGTKGRWS